MNVNPFLFMRFVTGLGLLEAWLSGSRSSPLSSFEADARLSGLNFISAITEIESRLYTYSIWGEPVDALQAAWS
jgi:hypothetical protein